MGAPERGGGGLRYHVLTEQLLRESCRKAREMGHSWVGPMHFLLALSREPGPAGQVLRLLGVEPDLTENMARLLYGFSEASLPLPQGLTAEARLLLRQAAGEARRQKQHQLQPHHLLLAMARQENSTACRLLEFAGVSGDALLTHTVEYLQWERYAPVKPKKEESATKNPAVFLGGACRNRTCFRMTERNATPSMAEIPKLCTTKYRQKNHN